MNPILSFDNFKAFVISLINSIIDRVDTKLAAKQVELDKMSADATVANQTIIELRTALANKDQEKATELGALAGQQLAALDSFSTELAEKFNPDLGKDSVAEIVTSAPEIVTPPVVAESTEVGTGTETPAEVGEAAVEAIASTAEAQFEV